MQPLAWAIAVVSLPSASLTSAIWGSGSCVGDEFSLMQKSTQLSLYQPIHQHDSLQHKDATRLPRDLQGQAPPPAAKMQSEQASQGLTEQSGWKEVKAARQEANDLESAAQASAQLDAVAQWQAARM